MVSHFEPIRALVSVVTARSVERFLHGPMREVVTRQQTRAASLVLGPFLEACRQDHHVAAGLRMFENEGIAPVVALVDGFVGIHYFISELSPVVKIVTGRMQQRLFAVGIVPEKWVNASVEDVVLALVVRIGTTGCHGVVLFGDVSLWQRHAVILKVDKVSGGDVFPSRTYIVRIVVAIVTQIKNVVAAIREEGDAVSNDTRSGFVEKVHSVLSFRGEPIYVDREFKEQYYRASKTFCKTFWDRIMARFVRPFWNSFLQEAT